MLRKLLFSLTFFVLALSGCRSVQNDRFAVYLLAKDIPSSELEKADINHLEIQTKPIISSDDIVSYDKVNHTIVLTQEAFTRVQQLFSMPVNVQGTPFVVCVGKDRIYTGAFWTPLSSLSYDGVVIMQSFDTKNPTIQITLGYPSREAFTGKDPRADSRIMDALEQETKLK